MVLELFDQKQFKYLQLIVNCKYHLGSLIFLSSETHNFWPPYFPCWHLNWLTSERNGAAYLFGIIAYSMLYLNYCYEIPIFFIQPFLLFSLSVFAEFLLHFFFHEANGYKIVFTLMTYILAVQYASKTCIKHLFCCCFINLCFILLQTFFTLIWNISFC